MIASKKRFVVLMADGARYDVFAELLDSGQLPHLQEVFVAEGTFAKATSVFPSTTGPAYMPFLTGFYPGTCNVPGIRWFDKNLYAEKRAWSLHSYRSYVGFESFFLNRDIQPGFPTLFEQFPRSYNIFNSVNRGVPSQNNLTAHMRIWYWYYAHLTDRWHLVDEAALEKTLKVFSEDFQFLFTLFPGVDEYSHLSHARHPQALEAYRFIDRAVGKMVSRLKKEGKWEETALFIVSDHGLSQIQQHFGVAAYLESRGIKTFYYPKIFKKDFDAASMVSGNGMLHLYFKGHHGWKGRMGREEIQERQPGLMDSLLEHPAIDLMLLQGDSGWIHARSREGEVKMRDLGEQIEFINLQGDPLELNTVAAIWSKSESLAKTLTTRHPDSLMQILQIFRSSRTGDLVLSASKGFDLRKRFEHPEHKSSHGALHDEHMLIPLFSSVPMQRSFARSADFFPSLLKLHGDPLPPYALDGESFF